MILSGKSEIVVNGKVTRILSRRFNQFMKRHNTGSVPAILDISGGKIHPSKGLAWSAVAALVRQGKKVQARVEPFGARSFKVAA